LSETVLRLNQLRRRARELETSVAVVIKLDARMQREPPPVPPPELDDGAHFVTQK
jgi:hypothetical protein